MQNRRDQAQAHAFVVGRLAAALLRAEPDSPMTPLRRFSVGAVVGVLLGALGLVGFGVWGFVAPGSSGSWRQSGVLLLEKESGSRYILVDGELRSVLNYASARLILGGAPKIVSVSAKSLRDVPRGLPIGIVGAPDALPDPDRLNGREWTVCSALHQDATGTDRPYVTLRIGPTSAIRAATPGQGLLVRTPSGQLYLAWDSHRLRLPGAGTLDALGYSAAPRYTVGWAWINALPAGPDLAPPDVPGIGQTAPSVAGHTGVVGQLFTATSAGSTQSFVLRTDGLSPVTPVGAALLLASPHIANAYPGGRATAIELTPAELAQAPKSALATVDSSLPADRPEPMPVQAGDVPCLAITLTTQGAAVHAGIGTAATVDRTAVGTGSAHADRVVVSPGSGLLARELPAPGVTGGTLHLLVDNGVRYPLPNDSAAQALGFTPEDAVPVPALVLDLVPAGPPLDPEAARASVSIESRAEGETVR